MIELLQTALNVGLVLIVMAMVLLIVAAWWMTRLRHKSYEDYLASKRRIEQGTRIASSHVEPIEPWGKLKGSTIERKCRTSRRI